MIYHRSNPVNRLFSKKRIALAAFFTICIAGFLYAPTRNMLTEGVSTIAVTVWGAGNAISSSWNSLATNFQTKEVLMNENESLHEEMSRMQAQVLDRNLLAEKVARLEESLGRSRSDNRVTAEVVVGPGRSPYDTLVIDAGAEQGINTGDAVVYAGSGVIGEIVEVTSFSAKVKLYSSPGEEHDVVVGSHNFPVIALGRGMGNFEARVPQDSVVSIGDAVLSKESLILGIVSLIEEKPAEPFKRIFFRVPFNIIGIRSVEVIVNKHS